LKPHSAEGASMDGKPTRPNHSCEWKTKPEEAGSKKSTVGSGELGTTQPWRCRQTELIGGRCQRRTESCRLISRIDEVGDDGSDVAG
jgi:hypothetical protein